MEFHIFITRTIKKWIKKSVNTDSYHETRYRNFIVDILYIFARCMHFKSCYSSKFLAFHTIKYKCLKIRRLIRTQTDTYTQITFVRFHYRESMIDYRFVRYIRCICVPCTEYLMYRVHYIIYPQRLTVYISVYVSSC